MDIILSDIHANLYALRAIMRFIRRRKLARFVFLGDLVGYGAQPNQVLDLVLGLSPRFLVRGNHDRAAIFSHEDYAFSLPARQSAQWTRQHLSLPHLRYLGELRSGPLWIGQDYQIVHGSPLNEDAYLLHSRDAHYAFEDFEGQLCFFGHTHLPGVFELDTATAEIRWMRLEHQEVFPLKDGCRYLVNPGSVGQPRDRDARASFMTYDPGRKRLKLHRLPYDIQSSSRAILAAGLHPALAERLHHGV